MGVGSHVWLVVGVAALGLSSGCSDDGGGGGAGGANAGGAGGGASIESWLDGECGVCASTECSDEIQACTSDPGCSSYWSCLAKCPTNALNGDADGDCETLCEASSSSESTKLRVGVQYCRREGDGAENCKPCGHSGGTDGPEPQSCRAFEPPPEAEVTPCRECYWDRCCETWSASYADAGCDAIGTCLESCEDSACFEACFDANDASVDHFLAQYACGREQCAADTDTCDATDRTDCQACYHGTCSESWAAILGDRDAFLIYVCSNLDCASEDFSTECLDACYSAHPAGEEKNFLWIECVSAQCSDCTVD